MAVTFDSLEVKCRGEKRKAWRLVRTIKTQSAAAPAGEQPQPELPAGARRGAEPECPYDILYLIYDYIARELGVKNPVN